MIRMSRDKDMDLKLIKYMVDNQDLTTPTLKFLINYLLDSIENDWSEEVDKK